MAQMVVRNIDDEAFARLKARARARGVSAEALARALIESGARPERGEIVAESDRLRALTLATAESSGSLIRAFRDGDDPDR